MVEEDVGELELEVVLREGGIGLVAERGVPSEVGANVDGELGSQPNELRGVHLDATDAAGVRFEDRDGVGAKLFDSVQVRGEHVRVLVVFCGYVLFDGSGERNGVSSAELEAENVSSGVVSCIMDFPV